MENTENTTTAPSSKKMNPMMIVIAVVVLVVIGGGVFVFMKKSSPESAKTSETQEQIDADGDMDGDTMTIQPTQPQGSSATGTGSTMVQQEFTVEGGNFFFKPNELKVKKGKPVTVVFKNTEGFHDFVIDEIAGAKTNRIQTGTSETITFTPDKAGSFEFYCSVGSHRQMGMKGTLIVEE